MIFNMLVMLNAFLSDDIFKLRWVLRTSYHLSNKGSPCPMMLIIILGYKSILIDAYCQCICFVFSNLIICTFHKLQFLFCI